MSGLGKPGELRQRNQRTALYLVGWIAVLAAASILVVWVGN